jgi:hypothetical protein
MSLNKILNTNNADINRWLGKANVIMALCACGVSAALLYQAREAEADPLGVLQKGALLYIACALSFFIAYVAIRRNWRHRWLLQVTGPALVFFTIYGPW